MINSWLPAIIVMLAILILAIIPGKTMISAGLGSDTYHVNGHFLFFSLLCFVVYKPLKSVPGAAIFTLVYGIVIELIQLYVPNRACSLFDIFTDTMGTIISVLILWKLQHYLPKILRNWLVS